jgi:hypothetical protein
MWRLAAILKCCIIMRCHELVQCTCFKLRYLIFLSPTHTLPSVSKPKSGHTFCFMHLSYIIRSYSPQINYPKNFRRSAQLYTSSVSESFRLSYVENVPVLRVIWGFRRGVDENCVLLGYYVANIGNSLATCRDRLPGNGAKELPLITAQ